MSKLPAVMGKEVLRALEKAGFSVDRQRGSHHFMRHPDGRTATVPIHAGETLGPGLLAKILRDSEIERDAFLNLLR